MITPLLDLADQRACLDALQKLHKKLCRKEISAIGQSTGSLMTDPILWSLFKGLSQS